MDEQINPFNITKAVDLSDIEINRLWVDFSGSKGFETIVKPKSPMPMLILGGKGSGKTHIMRHFSYPLQKIRHGRKLLVGIQNDGYLGVYFRCSGLNASRFHGKNQDDDTWAHIFAYYIELWLAQIVLEIIDDINKSDTSLNLDEQRLSNAVLELFDKYPEKTTPKSLIDVIRFLGNLRKEIDFIVNNSAWTRSTEGLRINASPGRLAFGIPSFLATEEEKLSKIKFLYLIDEFENLENIHQVYVNTLIREKQLPSSIKVGARLYGVRTYRTLSAGEENKEQSEFETVIIDDVFRKNEYGYKKFAMELCRKRLLESGYSVSKSLEDVFEKFELRDFLDRYKKKYYDRTRPHFERLRKRLQGLEENTINEIVGLLSFTEDPLLERTNVFMFYRDCSENENVDGLMKIAAEISSETTKLSKNQKRQGRHRQVLDKFKSDLIAQLMLESGEKNQYTGLSTFIDMSEGIPRNFLMVFKHIVRWSLFNEEFPFTRGIISMESQSQGVIDASEWFFEDARLTGVDGKNIRDSISRLASLLREIRFSDRPPECSLSAFSVNLSELPSETERIIRLSTQYSYLIKVGERKQKNSKRLDSIYKINGILAPKWDLPIYKRGEIGLSKLEAEAIFSSSSDDDFKSIVKKRLATYNLNLREMVRNQSELFEE